MTKPDDKLIDAAIATLTAPVFFSVPYVSEASDTLIRALAFYRTEHDRLKAAISKHHAQKADDRCFMDDDELYAAAGLPKADIRAGDKAAMLKNCERFIANRCTSGGWKSYAELEAEVERLKQRIAELEDDNDNAHVRRLAQYGATLKDERDKARAEVERLKTLPCDPGEANEWLKANAPKHVHESLWAWRRIAEDGLEKHKAEVERLKGELATVKTLYQNADQSIPVVNVPPEEEGKARDAWKWLRQRVENAEHAKDEAIAELAELRTECPACHASNSTCITQDGCVVCKWRAAEASCATLKELADNL